MDTDAIFCIGKDPWGEPQGGQANFARQMITVFGSRLAVASVSEVKLPIRRWCKRTFEDKEISFFNLGRHVNRNGNKPIIPVRISMYSLAQISMHKIFTFGIRNLFIESPEMLFAAMNYKWDSVCYRFAGVNNPVENSRYVWARKLGVIYEKIFFAALKKINAQALLASADQYSIDEMVKRSRGMIDKEIVHFFPTRVDTKKFKPILKSQAREFINEVNSKIIIVTCGRLSWVKGWDLLLNSVSFLKSKSLDFKLIFVGDGEDRNKIINTSKRLKIESFIKITGFVPHEEVSSYLNAADLCVVASHREGWSLAMLEILACGKPIVSTNVSGAKDMVRHGENGYVVKERDARIFANNILDALNLKNASKVSLEIADRYSTRNIAADLGKIWSPLFTQ